MRHCPQSSLHSVFKLSLCRAPCHLSDLCPPRSQCPVAWPLSTIHLFSASSPHPSLSPPLPHTQYPAQPVTSATCCEGCAVPPSCPTGAFLEPQPGPWPPSAPQLCTTSWRPPVTYLACWMGTPCGQGQVCLCPQTSLALASIADLLDWAAGGLLGTSTPPSVEPESAGRPCLTPLPRPPYGLGGQQAAGHPQLLLGGRHTWPSPARPCRWWLADRC